MSVYIITGSNSPVGSAYCRYLVSTNPQNTVIGLQRHDTPAHNQVEGVKYVHCEVTDPESVTTAAQEVSKISGGKVDVLFNSAGYMVNHDQWPLGEIPLEKEVELMKMCHEANVVNPLLVTSAFIPLLRAGTQKRIYLASAPIGSIDTVKNLGLPGMYAYTSSRAGGNMLAALFANQLKKEDFTVIAVMLQGVFSQELLESEQGQMIVKQCKQIDPNWRSYTPDQGAELILTSLVKLGPGDSGRAVGMWGDHRLWAEKETERE